MHLLGHAHPMVVSENNKTTLLVDGVKRLHDKLDNQNSELHSALEAIHQEADNKLGQIAHEYNSLLTQSIERISTEISASSNKNIEAINDLVVSELKHFSKIIQNHEEIKTRMNWLILAASFAAIGTIGTWVKLLIKHM